MADHLGEISSLFRDKILSRNLPDPETITGSGYINYLQDRGKPTLINDNPTKVIPKESLDEISDYHRDITLGYNVYKNEHPGEQYSIENETHQRSLRVNNNPGNGEYGKLTNDQASPLEEKAFSLQKALGLKNKYGPQDGKYEKTSISTQVVLSNPNSKSQPYTSTTFKLSNGSSISSNAVDTIGGLLSQGGIGANPAENFDLKASLLGRVLAGTGLIEDSPLGLIAAQRLATELGNRMRDNLLQETVGHINTNPLSLLMGNEFIVPNYTITVHKSGGGKVVDFLSKIGGFEIPVSYIGEEASIFSKESKELNNIDRNNELLLYTGKGQKLALLFNLQQNKYKPAYLLSEKNEIAPEYYYGSDPKSQEPKFNFSLTQSNEKNPQNYGWDNPNTIDKPTKVDGEFYWEPVQLNVDPNDPIGSAVDNAVAIARSNPFNPKSLLYKTQNLINQRKIWSSVQTERLVDKTEIQSVGENGLMSKGSAVLAEDGKTFCRVWTTVNRYDTVNKLIRHSGLKGGANRSTGIDYSVLDSNGFAKIAPYINEQDPRRFMLSIENLAWNNYTPLLPPCEVGPGDPVTGAKGRIMWFPPYDINFSESANANWESTQFIGRLEPLYTYNNVERSGNLSFKIIIDHPAVLNDYKDQLADSVYRSFFAGCRELPKTVADKLTPDEVIAVKIENKSEEVEVPIETPPEFRKVEVFFPNDRTEIYSWYEDGDKSNDLQTEGDDGHPWPNNTDFGLNQNFNSCITELIEHMTKYEACDIEITGYASIHGNKKRNEELGNKRANWLLEYLKSQLASVKDIQDRISVTGLGDSLSTFDPKTVKVDDEIAKRDRKAVISVKFKPQKAAEAKKPKTDPSPEAKTLNEKIVSRLVTECDYFEKIKQTDPLIYKTLGEKIKHFHPAFHSTTPEGLNSRITFLQQCLRPGPTENQGVPDNLAFGTPPVCILRVGDFYHTKIIIDNINFDYDPLVWDLNPEGVGVQPMIVTVNLSFKMIGGSSMQGPINKLQNALSFNYYANTEIYDGRSDTLSKDKIVSNFDQVVQKKTEELNEQRGIRNQEARSEETPAKNTPPSDKEIIDGINIVAKDQVIYWNGVYLSGSIDIGNVKGYGLVLFFYNSNPNQLQKDRTVKVKLYKTPNDIMELHSFKASDSIYNGYVQIENKQFEKLPHGKYTIKLDFEDSIIRTVELNKDGA